MGECVDEFLTIRLRQALRTPWGLFSARALRDRDRVSRVGVWFLAKTQHGSYVRINGSLIQPLDRGEVLAALRVAQRSRAARYLKQPADPRVTVRKSWRISGPEDVAR